MSEDLDKAIERTNWGLRTTVWVATALTVLGCVLALALAGPQVVHCASEWNIFDPGGWFAATPPDGFKCMNLNEFGDFLAGTFAPLAFLWLVLAVFLQRAELSDQKTALLAQLKESQQHTDMFLAERSDAKTRSDKEALDNFLGELRSRIPSNRYNLDSSIDDNFRYWFSFGKLLADEIENNVAGTMDNTTRNGRENYLKRLKPSLESLSKLKELSERLKGANLELFHSCHMMEIERALTLVKDYLEKIERSD
jgi:hypothetical protein